MVTGRPKWNAHRTLAASRTLLDLLAGALQQRGATGVDREALLFVGAESGLPHYVDWRKGDFSLPACQAAGLGDLRGSKRFVLRIRPRMVVLAVDAKASSGMPKLDGQLREIDARWNRGSRRARNSVSDQRDRSGGSKNRTCALSIISTEQPDSSEPT